jgi:hypothetical protein
MDIEDTQVAVQIPNGHEIHHTFKSKSEKCIFGIKIYHLATLVESRCVTGLTLLEGLHLTSIVRS